jgi:hypothetical protein
MGLFSKKKYTILVTLVGLGILLANTVLQENYKLAKRKTSQMKMLH